MKFKYEGSRVKYTPDILKQYLHQVHVVMLDASTLKAGVYDTQDISKITSVGSTSSIVRDTKGVGSATTKMNAGLDASSGYNKDGSESKATQKVSAFSLSSKINFTSTIEISDVINDAFGKMGAVGTFALNRLDNFDDMTKGKVGQILGLQGKLPPLVPKISYERKTAYGGASPISSSVSLIFPFVNNFNDDVIKKVNTLSNWYLPNRMGNDLGETLGKSIAFLEPKSDDSSIVKGVKAIGSAIQDVAADIFKNCFLLKVPVGARNPTRIYFGPDSEGFAPVYCGEWLVTSFGLSTTDFVIYDINSKCLRPEFVQVDLGLMSWRVTDNQSFHIFNNYQAAK